MISDLLLILERGLNAMRKNSKVLFIGSLVFVFPLLFIWISQIFFTTAYDNIHTSEKRRVGMVHDTLSAALNSYDTDRIFLSEMAKTITSQNADVTKIRIYLETDNGFLIAAADDSELIGDYDPTATTLRQLGFSSVLDFQQIEFLVNGDRIWQAYKRVPVGDTFYYIFSEHNLAKVDGTMSFRRQQSYYGLTAIFLFLIALAYWLHRQTDWQVKHERLTEKLQERDLFSNMIAHEFRSPLTAIKGYASFLEESSTLPPDEKRFAQNIRQSAEFLVALVGDFLEVARLQSGKLQIVPQPTDIRTVINTTLETLRGVAGEKGLDLVFVDPGKPLMLTTDPQRLQQVLTNVITNAIKYTSHGSVTLACALDYDTLTIRVMDTGMGISAEDQKKLFAPFTRVGGVDSTKVVGTGLGMYITKQLIELLGGSVGVESIRGVGSHIVLTFKTK